MSEPNLNQLKAIAAQLESSQPTSEKMASLKQAFQLFSDETKRLEHRYVQLKEDFRNINQELEATNTKLIQKVQELDTATNYLKNILTNMSQGLIFINLAGTVTTFNRAAERILGQASMDVLFQLYQKNFPDDLFGFSMQQALSQRQQPPTPLLVKRAGETESQELEVDVRFVLKEKDVATSTTRDEHLDFTEGLILLIKDVTEIHRLRRTAERNDRLKELGEMAASVAHEIRNPLGGIKGFASLLQRDLKNQPHLQQMAAYIIEGTENLNRLVTNVLHYARPIQLNLEKVDLVPVMLDLLTSVRMDNTLSRGVEYQLNVDVDEVFVKVDTYLLRSVLLNLVVNAVQAMPSGGNITFSIHRDALNVMLDVSDTGVGIPQENLDKIFAPFYTTKAEGNGFGLTEALKVVQAHGGTLEVQSQTGVGTTFTVKIPVIT